MSKRQGKLRKGVPSEHLREYLKSSYAERLDWLEGVNKFVSKLLRSKPNAGMTNREKAGEKEPRGK